VEYYQSAVFFLDEPRRIQIQLLVIVVHLRKNKQLDLFGNSYCAHV
jgi:hypothetical protein